MASDPKSVSTVTLALHDLLAIPAVGEKIIGAITQIRPERFVLRLEEKFEPSIDIDVVTRAPQRASASLGRARFSDDQHPAAVDMLGNALRAGDSIAIADMQDSIHANESRPVIVVRVIREIINERLVNVEREPGSEVADGEDPREAVKVASASGAIG